MEVGALSPDDGGLYLESAARAVAGRHARALADRSGQPIGWVPDSLMDDPAETKRGTARGLRADPRRTTSSSTCCSAHGLPLVGNGRAELEAVRHASGGRDRARTPSESLRTSGRSCRACRRRRSGRRPWRPRSAGRWPRPGRARAVASSGSTLRSTARAVSAFSSSGAGAQRRAVDPGALDHQQAEVDLAVGAGADADHGDPPAGAERAQVVGHVRARRPARGSRRTARASTNSSGASTAGAERRDALAQLGVADGRGHAGARGAAELHRRGADPAGGAVDEQPLARLQPRLA